RRDGRVRPAVDAARRRRRRRYASSQQPGSPVDLLRLMEFLQATVSKYATCKTTAGKSHVPSARGRGTSSASEVVPQGVRIGGPKNKGGSKLGRSWPRVLGV